MVCQNSHPIKNIKWSYNLSLQLNLLLNFVQSLIILSLKKFRVVTHFFKGKKIIKLLNFIYNNDFFFSKSGWSCDHLGSNVEPPVQANMWSRPRNKSGQVGFKSGLSGYRSYQVWAVLALILGNLGPQFVPIFFMKILRPLLK